MVQLEVKILSSFKDKSIGLINKKEPFSILIKTRFGIHTFGVRFPIDILILNKENIVVRICKRLKPNRIFFWNPLFNTVIELPQGEIEKMKIKVGEKIIILKLSD